MEKHITHRLPQEESRYMDMVHMSRDMEMDMVLMGAKTLRLSLYLKNELYFLIRYPHHLGLMVNFLCHGRDIQVSASPGLY